MEKSLRKNYVYNLFYQLLVMFLPLIVTPYLSRVLGAEKIGIYSFTSSILSYFTLFGCLGISLYGQREIAAVQNNKDIRTKIFWELFILKAITIFISLIFFAIFNYNDEIYGIYYKILTIELLSNVIDITWFFQGLEDFKKVTIRNTIVRVLSVLLTLLLVKNEEDLIIYFIVNVLTNFISFLSLWIKLNKYVKPLKFKNLNILYHVKQTILLFIPQVAIQMYTVFDKTMLGLILNDMNEVGYYEQTQKVVKMLLMLIAALGTVMIPRISNLYANNQLEELKNKIYKVFNIVSFIAFPMCFGLIAVANTFVPWFYGQEFIPIINLISICSFLLIAIGLNNITGMQYLIPTKKQNIFTISVTVGAMINLILNFILIPNFKSCGATVASIVSEFSILFIHLIYLKKVFDFKEIFFKNVKYLIISFVMFVCVYSIGNFLKPTIISTIIEIVVGAIIYLGALLVTKDEMLFEIFRNVKKLIKK